MLGVENGRVEESFRNALDPEATIAAARKSLEPISTSKSRLQEARSRYVEKALAEGLYQTMQGEKVKTRFGEARFGEARSFGKAPEPDHPGQVVHRSVEWDAALQQDVRRVIRIDPGVDPAFDAARVGLGAAEDLARFELRRLLSLQ